MIKLHDFIMACHCESSRFVIYVGDAPIMTIEDVTYDENDKKTLGNIDLFGNLEIERFNAYQNTDGLTRYNLYVVKGKCNNSNDEEKDKQISELQATIDVQDKVISELNDMFHLIKRYGAIQITDNNSIIYTEDEKILFTKLCQKLGVKPDILQKLSEELK